MVGGCCMTEVADCWLARQSRAVLLPELLGICVRIKHHNCTITPCCCHQPGKRVLCIVRRRHAVHQRRIEHLVLITAFLTCIRHS